MRPHSDHRARRINRNHAGSASAGSRSRGQWSRPRGPFAGAPPTGLAFGSGDDPAAVETECQAEERLALSSQVQAFEVAEPLTVVPLPAPAVRGALSRSCCVKARLLADHSA